VTRKVPLRPLPPSVVPLRFFRKDGNFLPYASCQLPGDPPLPFSLLIEVLVPMPPPLRTISLQANLVPPFRHLDFPIRFFAHFRLPPKVRALFSIQTSCALLIFFFLCGPPPVFRPPLDQAKSCKEISHTLSQPHTTTQPPPKHPPPKQTQKPTHQTQNPPPPPPHPPPKTPFC